MAMIRPETEMKDSGVQWIGDIPSDWNIKPLYACLDEINQKNNPVVTTNILSLTNTDGVIPYSERGNQGNKSKENFEEYKVVYPNTIVANSMNILIGSVGLSKYEGCVSPVYYVYMAKPQVDIRYMNYLFQMEPFQKRLRQFANGILEIRLRVSSHDILHQKVAVPDYDEQQTIADYLDETCSKIDEIIAEAKASIDEYKELKQSVIFEAVTKGLDKNVYMRDSGVEWIGAIPKTWDILSLKYMCTMQAGKNLISEQIADSGKYSVYGGNGLRGYYSSYNTEGRHLLVGRQGALCGNVHDVDGQYWCTEHAIVTTETKFSDIDYLFYLLIGMNLNQYASNAAAQPGLSVGNILNVKTVKPSMDEQKEIATYLKNILPKYNSLITEKESLINDLEAYKKSLIYEVVTGKRRVV